MLKPIGFSAFLKLVELADGPRKTALKKKLGGGKGFQYWRPVQTVAPKAILPAADFAALKQEIDGLCSGHQRKYNNNAFDAFCKWVEGKAITASPSLPTIDVPFGSSGLTIRLKPNMSFELEGKLYSINLWATTKPELSRKTLSIGLRFCANAFKAKGYTHNHLILDTVKNRLFREDDILPNALHLLKDKVDAFKKDWDELNSIPPAPGPNKDEKQPPIHPKP